MTKDDTYSYVAGNEPDKPQDPEQEAPEDHHGAGHLERGKPGELGEPGGTHECVGPQDPEQEAPKDHQRELADQGQIQGAGGHEGDPRGTPKDGQAEPPVGTPDTTMNPPKQSPNKVKRSKEEGCTMDW